MSHENTSLAMSVSKETVVETFLPEKSETVKTSTAKVKWTVRVVLVILMCTTLGLTTNKWELCLKYPQENRQPEPLRVMNISEPVFKNISIKFG